MSNESSPPESLSAADSVHPSWRRTFYEQIRALPLWSNPFLDDRRHERAAGGRIVGPSRTDPDTVPVIFHGGDRG
jgi:hypothetical protein